MTRTDYRRLASAARELAATLAGDELAQPPLDALAGKVLAQVPAASREQATRALRKAIRRRQGETSPRSGSPPNFSLQLEERQLKFLRERASEYGSQSAVLRAALDRLMQETADDDPGSGRSDAPDPH